MLGCAGVGRWVLLHVVDVDVRVNLMHRKYYSLNISETQRGGAFTPPSASGADDCRNPQ